jgi:hypothetical protein
MAAPAHAHDDANLVELHNLGVPVVWMSRFAEYPSGYPLQAHGSNRPPEHAENRAPGKNMRGLVNTVAAALLLTGCGASANTAATTVTAKSTITETVTYTPAPPPGPKTTIDDDGTYAVGADIVPGTYRTAGRGMEGEPDCYWARLRSLDTLDIINNNNSLGPQIVEVQPSDTAFLTQNCLPWQKTG